MRPAITNAYFDSRPVPIVTVDSRTTGDEIADALRLPPLRGLVIVNGGTGEVAPEIDARLRVVMDKGLVPVVVDRHLALLTGGTDAGIFGILGQALASRPARPPCIGIAPSKLVSWPGQSREPSTKARSPDAVPLEPHHSHFVLVDGEKWGDETVIMLDLAAALERSMPSVVVVAGGGTVTKREILGHVRQRRTIIVLRGTGRFADELASALQIDRATGDAAVAEIVRDGHLVMKDVREPSSSFAAAIIEAMGLAQRED